MVAPRTAAGRGPARARRPRPAAGPAPESGRAPGGLRARPVPGPGRTAGGGAPLPPSQARCFDPGPAGRVQGPGAPSIGVAPGRRGLPRAVGPPGDGRPSAFAPLPSGGAKGLAQGAPAGGIRPEWLRAPRLGLAPPAGGPSGNGPGFGHRLRGSRRRPGSQDQAPPPPGRPRPGGAGEASLRPGPAAFGAAGRPGGQAFRRPAPVSRGGIGPLSTGGRPGVRRAAQGRRLRSGAGPGTPRPGPPHRSRVALCPQRLRGGGIRP